MKARRTLEVPAVVMSVALALILSAGVQGQELAAPASEHRGPGGPAEGIKVHGHWLIEIRDPDGTIASRREFDNALLEPSALAGILARRWSVGLWEIDLFGNAPSPFGADLVTATEGPDLTIEVPASGPNAGKLVMKARGAFRTTAAGRLALVRTRLNLCPANQPPSNPTSCLPQVPFTGCLLPGSIVLAPGGACAGITQPIDVQADQGIDVTVVLSFS